MQLARFCDALCLLALCLLALCLFMSCSAHEELQPARLIEARGYDRDTPQQPFPLPVNGDGIIAATTIIELVFDKPVLEVSINSINAEPNVVPLATVWTLDSRRLDVWIGKTGMLETVSLTINYKDDTGVHTETLDVRLDLQSVTPRVIAVEPIPGFRHSEAVELSALTQKFRVTFNEPIIPNSGRIMFGGASIQLQGTKATDTITWNQCFRRLRNGLEPDTLVISDFQNVNGEVQPHAFVGWYWMAIFDITPPAALEYYPIGENVDPETTREISVVFDRPMAQAFVEISPPIHVVFMGIENERVRECSGIATWRIVNQLEYSTNYDVKIRAFDMYAQKAFSNFSFTTKASPASD